MMSLVGHVAYIGEMRNACRISVGRSEKKTPLGRSGYRYMVTKLTLKGKTGWVDVG
jgi:hypothetical protein